MSCCVPRQFLRQGERGPQGPAGLACNLTWRQFYTCDGMTILGLADGQGSEYFSDYFDDDDWVPVGDGSFIYSLSVGDAGGISVGQSVVTSGPAIGSEVALGTFIISTDPWYIADRYGVSLAAVQQDSFHQFVGFGNLDDTSTGVPTVGIGMGFFSEANTTNYSAVISNGASFQKIVSTIPIDNNIHLMRMWYDKPTNRVFFAVDGETPQSVFATSLPQAMAMLPTRGDAGLLDLGQPQISSGLDKLLIITILPTTYTLPIPPS